MAATARTVAKLIKHPRARGRNRAGENTLEEGTKKRRRVERRNTRLRSATPLSISISALNRPPPLLCSPLLADLAITGDRLLQLLILSEGKALALRLSRAGWALCLSPGVARQRKRGETLGEEEGKRVEMAGGSLLVPAVIYARIAPNGLPPCDPTPVSVPFHTHLVS
jgi:hypothetical protein